MKKVKIVLRDDDVYKNTMIIDCPYINCNGKLCITNNLTIEEWCPECGRKTKIEIKKIYN